MTAVLPLITALIPEIPALVADIKALGKKYPQLTPAQILAAVTALATSTDTEVAADLAQIAADQGKPAGTV